MSRENRLHPRVIVRIRAGVRVDDEDRGAGLLHDLSVSGAGLLTAAPLGLQAEVRIRFSLPDASDDAPPLDLACLVVRGGRLALPDDGFRYFSGLHFLPLSDETYEQIRTHVWNHPDREAP